MADPLDGYTRPLEATASDEGPTLEAVTGHLDRLAPAGLDGTTVYGLGEVAHGSREVFRLKHLLVRALVEHGWVRTLALEADAAATVILDRYVRRGDGSPEAALRSLSIWPWKARELVALARWLREFNRDREPSDRVSVRGISPSLPAAAADALASALEPLDRRFDHLETLASAGPAGLVDGDESADDSTGPPSRGNHADPQGLDAAEAAAADVADHLSSHRNRVVAAAGEQAWDEARHHCRVLERTCEWHGVRHRHEGPHAEGMAARDRAMADLAAGCAERAPGEGVAIWAHNTHVQRGRFDDGTEWADVGTMGEHLDDRFGDAYAPLATEVGRGAVRALGPGGDLDTFDLGDPLEGSLTARLDGDGPVSVDLRAASGDDHLGPLLAPAGRIRWVGSVFRGDPAAHYQETALPAAYDGLLFLPETRPSNGLD